VHLKEAHALEIENMPDIRIENGIANMNWNLAVTHHGGPSSNQVD